MTPKPFTPITDLQAYDQLSDAMNAVRQKYPIDFFQGPNFGENCLAAARLAIASLQSALIVNIDGIDPKTLASQKPGLIKLQIEITQSTHKALQEMC